MKKAYGFPLFGSESSEEVVGLCVTETGEVLGQWISSNILWLKEDLKSYAEGYEYVFLENEKMLPVDVLVALEKKANEHKT
jgi:hypothetical protein